MHPKIAVAALACAALQACASTGAAPPNTVALPGLVGGVLTSAIEYRPLTADDLARPGVRAGVEHCEKIGEVHCREDKRPRDRRTSFTAGVDPSVVAMLGIARLTPGAVYGMECRLIDPAGAVVSASPRAEVTPPPAAGPDAAILQICEFSLPARGTTGRWNVELAIDGRPVYALPFELSAGPGADEGSV